MITPETISSAEERLEYRKLKRRERLKRRSVEKQYEPRHYTHADESFARRLAAGFRIGGAE